MLVELSIAWSNRCVKIGSHGMLINVRRTFSELIGKKVDKVFHEVTLGHEKILAYVSTVALKLVLREKDVQKLLIGLLMRSLNPLL